MPQRGSHLILPSFLQVFTAAVSVKTCSPKTVPVYLLLKTVAMEGAEHQTGISERQRCHHNQAEHKQNQ